MRYVSLAIAVIACVFSPQSVSQSSDLLEFCNRTLDRPLVSMRDQGTTDIKYVQEFIDDYCSMSHSERQTRFSSVEKLFTPASFSDSKLGFSNSKVDADQACSFRARNVSLSILDHRDLTLYDDANSRVREMCAAQLAAASKGRTVIAWLERDVDPGYFRIRATMAEGDAEFTRATLGIAEEARFECESSFFSGPKVDVVLGKPSAGVRCRWTSDIRDAEVRLVASSSFELKPDAVLSFRAPSVPPRFCNPSDMPVEAEIPEWKREYKGWVNWRTSGIYNAQNHVEAIGNFPCDAFIHLSPWMRIESNHCRQPPDRHKTDIGGAIRIVNSNELALPDDVCQRTHDASFDNEDGREWTTPSVPEPCSSAPIFLPKGKYLRVAIQKSNKDHQCGREIVHGVGWTIVNPPTE